MPKPPQTTPHSDIDGVHRDARFNVDTANEAGQDTADLQRAHEGNAARPPYSDDKGDGGKGGTGGVPGA